MVEILMESGGQERVVADSGQSSPKISEISSVTDNVDLSPIQQFYTGQSILLTGGTGFLGKLLIEKLLRTCPGVNVIYLLVRSKKGKDMHQRTEELFDDPLFSKLKQEHPKFRHQVVAISGDCETPGLGISSADKATLINEVSIVFHVAATVRFDEKLKLAVSINVRAPREVICLCRQMHGLKSFIHVSTAYSHCPENLIEEKFYEPPIDGNKLITLMECMDEKLADDITPMLLGRWPNTYTFTKAVAEDIVKKEANNMPVGIFRPAIVISTYQEPIRGWIDNMYGPTGVAAGAGSGLLRSIHCDGSIQANVVPGDLTVNALICSAWDVVFALAARPPSRYGQSLHGQTTQVHSQCHRQSVFVVLCCFTFAKYCKPATAKRLTEDFMDRCICTALCHCCSIMMFDDKYYKNYSYLLKIPEIKTDMIEECQ